MVREILHSSLSDKLKLLAGDLENILYQRGNGKDSWGACGVTVFKGSCKEAKQLSGKNSEVLRHALDQGLM